MTELAYMLGGPMDGVMVDVGDVPQVLDFGPDVEGEYLLSGEDAFGFIYEWAPDERQQ